jgi:glycosyltransferase involved in cell wall biosynthesis
MTNSAPAPAGGAARRAILFQWEVSSLFGWGVYGINLMLSWARDPEVVALTSCPFRPADIMLGEEQMRVLAPLLERSRAFHATLKPEAGKSVSVSTLVLQAIGNELQSARSAHNIVLTGRPSIAVPFIEDTRMPEAAREDARRRYALWIAGSNWNARLFEGQGFGPVTTVMQGVDTVLFRPGPRTGRFGERFVVFSGGKLEHRKGQDLVLLAFRAFAARHPEALLLTAWHCPWAHIARTVEQNPQIAPVVFDAGKRVDVPAWAAANGVPANQFADVGAVPNWRMADVLREADVAVFPNRAEGGTNLVAMECMACGVPAIVAANTGQLDLVDSGACYPLRRQGPVGSRDGRGTEGWGESDVDEIVEALETVWRDRAAARAMGERGAAFMHAHSWATQMALLKETIRPYWG